MLVNFTSKSIKKYDNFFLLKIGELFKHEKCLNKKGKMMYTTTTQFDWYISHISKMIETMILFAYKTFAKRTFKIM